MTSSNQETEPLLVTLDIETFYSTSEKYTLKSKNLTILDYVMDARFHAFGIAVRYPNGQKDFRIDIPVLIQELQQAYGQELERITVVMQNSPFDYTILFRKYGLRIRNFIDTLWLFYSVHGRREETGAESRAGLADMAKFFSLTVRKDKDAIDAMNGVKNPTAKQMIDLSAYAKNDVEITYQVAMRLLPDVPRPEIELPLMQHTTRLYVERKGMYVDVAGLQKIIIDIEAEMDSFLRSKNLTIEKLKKNKGFHDAIAAALARTGRSVPTKLNKKGDEIPATAKKDAAMQELVRDGDPIVAMLAQGRVQAKSSDQVIAKIQAMIRLAKINDGFVPVYMRYGGAHTLRFAGGQQINWQNFGHKGVWNQVRECIHAAPGDKLVSGDLGQIEARVLVTLAGQQDMVEAFRNKRDIYSELAAKIFNEEVRKPDKCDPPEKADRLDSLRQIGKGATLGLGFQMGKKKFWVQQASEPKVAPLIAAGTFTRKIAASTVNAYRQTNPKVVEFWYACDAAAINAIKYNYTSMVGRCVFSFADGALLITLPSGRTMRYARARLVDRTGETITYMDDEGEDAEFETDGPGIVYGTRMDNGKDVGIHLYGGKIVENIVQAVARDIMVEMMLKLDIAPELAHVCTHCHDEISFSCRAGEAELVLEVMKSVMVKAPAWLPDVPLDVDAKILTNYAKRS